MISLNVPDVIIDDRRYRFIMLQVGGGPAAGISKGRIYANPRGDRVRDLSSRVDRRNETGTSLSVEATVIAG